MPRTALPKISLLSTLALLLAMPRAGTEAADRDPPTPNAPQPGSWRHVVTDGGAGAYEAFPDVCRTEDGRLFCVFYAGYDHVSHPSAEHPKGGRIGYATSDDEGLTWSVPRTLWDGPEDDRDPSIAQLSDGRLVCSFFQAGLGTWITFSSDGGLTWTEPRQLSDRYYASAPVRELTNGRLILGLYREADGEASGATIASDDGGATWRDIVEIEDGGAYLDAETDVVELENGELLAALRGRERLWWSRSLDRGESWSPAAAFDGPGHCPYLHRAVDGTLLLAHRLPATSLRTSVDEGRTWSAPRRIDDRIGAYPSMVNLRDGSVLVVYYEEGAGSDIRAKRFRAKRGEVEWLQPPDAALAASGARLVSVRRIWDAAPHNAFTDLVRHEGNWYCVFREGQGHVSPDGALRVITSDDGLEWTSSARITSVDSDLRDAKICVTPRGELMLSGAGALHDPKTMKHQSWTWFSSDGSAWSHGSPVADPNVWLWRVSWAPTAEAYGFGYSTADHRFIRLYGSTDGRSFDTLVPDAGIAGYPNETSIVFRADGTALCLLRRDPDHGLLGRATTPYTKWEWKDVGRRIGGPHMIEVPGGRLVAVVRLYDAPVRTSVCDVDPRSGRIEELLALPSGGDTSYAGLVWHEGLLWVSYYSSHEGKTAIYLARVALDPLVDVAQEVRK